VVDEGSARNRARTGTRTCTRTWPVARARRAWQHHGGDKAGGGERRCRPGGRFVLGGEIENNPGADLEPGE
jgi:hypothetical protein